jgi:hypothetical protein
MCWRGKPVERGLLTFPALALTETFSIVKSIVRWREVTTAGTKAPGANKQGTQKPPGKHGDFVLVSG